jgi:RNA polymerase sigma-70 factor (ECF subfamily)
MSTANLSDPDLRRLLVRAATGDVEAFLDFYDATCAVTWRLELCRHGDPARAKDAVTRRYVGAWLHAASQARSGLSARAWLLSLSPGLMPPLAWAAVSRVGA